MMRACVIDFGKAVSEAKTDWNSKSGRKYVGPFKVIEKVGEVAYKLEVLEELSRVHNTFHVSNLKKCHADEPLAVPLDGLHVDDKLHFVEEPVEIVDREVKRLKRSRNPLVKYMPRRDLLAVTQLGVLHDWYQEPRFNGASEEELEGPIEGSASISTISYDNESSDDDNDDDDVEKDEEDKEEKEHLASADPSAVPTDDPVPSS
ncbi:hypothetical protein Tco_0449917 [Tanacetum coccineum]